MADGDNGFGQQFPESSSSPFNADRFLVDRVIAQISTAKIVKIKAVDTAAKTVDVQPMVKQIDGQGNTTEHGTIFGVSYWIFQFGKNAILADPVVGDIGLMVCCDRDISAVKSSKKLSPPGSSRQLDAADGIYFGGLLNEAPEQWVKFTATGLELADKNNNSMVFGPTGITINGVLFNQQGQVEGNLPITGNLQLGGSMVTLAGATYSGTIQTTGDVIAGSISLKTHRTTGVTTGGGISGVPTP